MRRFTTESEQPAQPAPDWRCQWMQTWRHVLFAHWPVPIDVVERVLPDSLEPDIHDGHAWVSTVAFHLTTRPPGLPAVPFCSHLWELNLRTYVRRNDEPGLLFLSMHGGRRLPVWLGQRLTPLPYVFGRIHVDGMPPRHFRCHDSAGWPLYDSNCVMAGGEFQPTAGSIDAWLLERYSAFGSNVCYRWRMRVQHPPWSLSVVKAKVAAVGLGRRMGLDLHDPPALVHYSPGVSARTGRFEWTDQESVGVFAEPRRATNSLP